MRSGYLVYNPHRINVGCIGVVPEELNDGIVSGVYVVFRPRDRDLLPSKYLCMLLKSSSYQRFIRAYDTISAVRANLNWEQLCRIRIVVPNAADAKN